MASDPARRIVIPSRSIPLSKHNKKTMNTNRPDNHDGRGKNDAWEDRRITAFVLGELTADEAAEFESRLQSDPELAQAVDEARQLTDQLGRWFAADHPGQLDAVRRDSILKTGGEATTDHSGTPANVRQTIATPAAESADSALSSVSVISNTTASAAESDSTSSATSHSRRSWTLWLTLAASLVLAIGVWSLQPINPARLTFNERIGGHGPTNSASESQQVQASPETAAPDVEMPMIWSLKTTPADAGDPLPAQADSAPNRNEQSATPASAPAPGEPNAGFEYPYLGIEQGRLLSRDNYSDAEQLQRDGLIARQRSRGMDEISTGGMESPFGPRGREGMMGGMGGGMMVDSDMMRESSDLAARPALGIPQPAEAIDQTIDQGMGPGMAGDRFDRIDENPFRRPQEHPLSTFSIDVDTASYAKVRQYLLGTNRLPRPDVVRIEELVNYFDYNLPAPAPDAADPLAVDIEIAASPWQPGNRLARIAVQSRRVSESERPAANLTFLIDTSGSMNRPNRLPLVINGLERLLDQLRPDDRVAIVTYAGSAGLVLGSTPASETAKIRRALTRLHAGGSTNGGDGIRLAYQVSRDHFVNDGINRVILCTDGDFNVGTTSRDELVRLVEQEAKGGIDITVLGFGMGNHNDAMLEQISGRGNGNYAFIDTPAEARRVLAERITSTLYTIARDVKLQVEFNPAHVAAYRLIGYENRMLAKEDFNDDTKDAGEVGAGHSVTAFYEIIPRGGDTMRLPPAVDELKYQQPAFQPVDEGRDAEATDQDSATEPAATTTDDEWLAVKLRYKPIDGPVADAQSVKLEFIGRDQGNAFTAASDEFRFAALVAAFGLQLRTSEHRGQWTLTDVARELASLELGDDPTRAELVELVQRAMTLQVSE